MDIPIDCLIRAGQVETTEVLRKYAARKLSVALRPAASRLRSGTREAAGFVPCAFQIESPFQDEVGSLCRVRCEDAVLSVT